MNPSQQTAGPNTPKETKPLRPQTVGELLGAATITRTSLADEAISSRLRERARSERPNRPATAPVVGVQCGEVSGGLVAAYFPDAVRLGSFVDQSFALKLCPVTLWGGAPALWLRTDFLAQEDQDLEEIVWVTAGVAPLGWFDDSGAEVNIFRSGEPQKIPYKEIRWPVTASGIFRYPYLRSIYGPFFLQDKGRLVLNLNLWAAWTNERLGLAFDNPHGAFKLSSPQGTEARFLSLQTVEEMVTYFLQTNASYDPKHFPLQEIRPRRIRELVGLMRVMAVTSGDGQTEGLEKFLRLGIRREKGSDFTSSEGWGHYQKFCKAHNLDCLTQWEFLRVFPLRIRLEFGLGKPHSVERDGKPKRGFRGLALVAVEATDPTKPPPRPSPGVMAPEGTADGGSPGGSPE